MHMNTWAAWLSALGFSTLCLGCVGGDGGGGGGGSGGDSSALEGLYEITAHTENESGCDAPGPSVLDQEAPWLAGVSVTFFFAPVFTLHECNGLDDCRVVAADADASDSVPFFGGYIFENTSSNGATGRIMSASRDFSTNQCNGSVTRFELTRADDGSITLEQRTTEAAPFAPDSNDDCTTEAAEAAAEGQPCSSLRIINARFVEGL